MASTFVCYAIVSHVAVLHRLSAKHVPPLLWQLCITPLPPWQEHMHTYVQA
jgi:hypothetical protein